jgi:hypothetical protein
MVGWQCCLCCWKIFYVGVRLNPPLVCRTCARIAADTQRALSEHAKTPPPPREHAHILHGTTVVAVEIGAGFGQEVT